MEGGQAVSDTPRTDEQINGKPCTRFEILAGDSLRNAAVPSEFARTIERELNTVDELNKKINSLIEAGNELRDCASRIGTVAAGEASVIRRTQEAIEEWNNKTK
jgi:hypothetical protein